MAAAGPGSAYLTGPAAEAAACDAVLTTIVTGQIDWQVLDQLTTVWLTAHSHGHAERGPPDDHADGQPRKTTQTDRGKTRRSGRPEDRTDGPREDARGQAAGKPRREPADRPHRRPPPRLGPHPGSGHVPGPGPAGAPAAADGHDCAIAGCLEATRQRLQATIMRLEPRPAIRARRAGAGHLRGTLLGAPFNTRQPATGPRPHHPHHPAPPAHRRHPAGQALSVSRLHPAALRVRGASPDPVGQRRAHQPGKPSIALPVSPPHRDPSMGLENHLSPRRHPHRHRTRRPHPRTAIGHPSRRHDRRSPAARPALRSQPLPPARSAAVRPAPAANLRPDHPRAPKTRRRRRRALTSICVTTPPR